MKKKRSTLRFQARIGPLKRPTIVKVCRRARKTSGTVHGSRFGGHRRKAAERSKPPGKHIYYTNSYALAQDERHAAWESPLSHRSKQPRQGCPPNDIKHNIFHVRTRNRFSQSHPHAPWESSGERRTSGTLHGNGAAEVPPRSRRGAAEVPPEVPPRSRTIPRRSPPRPLTTKQEGTLRPQGFREKKLPGAPWVLQSDYWKFFGRLL